MRGNRFILLSFLCLNVCLAQLLHGTANRGPLSPKEATRAMLELMPKEKGFLTKLRALVNAGADVTATDKQDMTILHNIARFGGSSTAAKFILDRTGGDTPLITDSFRDTPLFLAIFSNNIGVTRALMEKDTDLNFFDNNGMTPLHYAIEYESHKVSKFLLTKGASLDIANKRGQTPLHLVTDKGVAEHILAKGGNPDARDNRGLTPLHYAVDFDNRALAKLLIKASSDINAKGGRDDLTPLHFVRSAELAELIIKNGGDPNAREQHEMTPLHQVKSVGIIRVFAMHGGDFNAVDKFGRTPLDYANTREFSQALVLFGADPEKSWKTKESKPKNSQKNESNEQHPSKSLYDKNNQSSDTKNSNQPDFLTNLNELALKKDSNPIIGRKKELAQVSGALRRKAMKGTVLVGDAGVGKTAIVEGLAYLLANDELPELEGREIFSLDVGSMWGHPDNKWVGQLQKRVNDALKFITAEPDKRILFIDEIHQLLGGGQVSSSGSPPITDILKPYLGRGDMQLIGATTHDEYQRIIEGDRAMVDRLLRIDINEPSAKETLTILRGIKADYEEHHNIIVTDAALKAAVSLSNRYMASQQQPRKAITLLDEASAAMPHDAKRLTKKHIATIVAEKVGINVATIMKSKTKKLQNCCLPCRNRSMGKTMPLKR